MWYCLLYRSTWFSICLLRLFGPNLEQFLETLGFQDTEDLNSNSSTIISLLALSHESHTRDFPTHLFPHQRSQGKAPLLNFVNALWVDHCFPLIPSYQQIAKNVYKAQVKNVDFVLQGEKVKREVNSWAEEETNGLIKEVLPPGTDLRPPLCHANAMYFKGEWQKKFKASRTSLEDFHLFDGKTIKVDFMTEYDEDFLYGEFQEYQLLKLPYKRGPSIGKQFSMYIFLPHTRDGLPDLLKKFNSNTSAILQPEHFVLRSVELEKLWIPRVKFSYDFDAKGLIMEKRLTLPFNQNRSDFANMVNSEPNNVFVSTLLHKAYVEVNEEGTEAAAVTFAGMWRWAAIRPYIPKPSFVADHPFMFMIVEDVSKLAVITRAVVNPLLV